MTLWESVWGQVKAEMPRPESRPKSWGGFLGATLAALVIIAIWFPIRLIAELLKTIDFSEKPDHGSEAQDLFREAYALSRDLPTRSGFAESVLRHVALPGSLHDAFFEALRALYAENMMLEVPPIPPDLENLDGIRWRDRMRREIARMKGDTLVNMRRACLTSIEAAVAGLPKIAGDSEITSPLMSLVHPGRFVENLVRPLAPDLFPIFAHRYEENVYRISGIALGKYTKPPKLAEPHHLDDPSPFLDGTPFAWQFFASDFNNPQFKQTKEQVIARLWAVLGNQTINAIISEWPQPFITLSAPLIPCSVVAMWLLSLNSNHR